MQTREFDNLMAGQPSKWAQFDQLPDLRTGIQKDEFKNEIQNKQVPIPEKTSSEINKFVTEQRQKGTKERTIRRLVKRKWNITVV